MVNRNRTVLQAVILGVLVVLAMIISVSRGSADLSVPDILKIIFGRNQDNSVYQTIIWNVRIPRVLLSFLTGAGLALAGTTLQGLFQNPLADPHILGVSSGAALGATIAMLSGVRSVQFMGIRTTGLCAFAGALLAAVIVYGIARSGGHVMTLHIVLAGTAVSQMLSAIISILMIYNRNQIEKVYFWTMGSFSAASWDKVAFLGIFIVICLPGLLFLASRLDAMSTGEDTAASLGVDTVRTKKMLIVIASLLVAACVSVSGIIGFVGLIIPHVLRMLTGAGHRKLLPFSALGGAAFLMLCDTLSRTAAAPSELPVGAVTALFGGPYFICLLYRNKKKVF